MIPGHGPGARVVFERCRCCMTGLKLVGSAYLLWLAWKVANASGPAEGNRPLIPAHQGPCCKLLNPKAWMMALSAISGFTLAGAYWPSAGWSARHLLRDRPLYRAFWCCSVPRCAAHPHRHQAGVASIWAWGSPPRPAC